MIGRELREGKRILGVWGCGYIGLTCAAYFAKAGVKVIGYDIKKDYVASLNDGIVPMPNVEDWMGFKIYPLIEKGLLCFTSSEEKMLNEEIGVHIIAVPTEKNGVPWDEAIIDCFSKIIKRSSIRKKPEAIIIESTLTPGKFNEIISAGAEKEGLNDGKDIFLGIAPRRDWFQSPEKNIRTLQRVFGSNNKESSAELRQILSIVSDNLLEASSAEVAELTKSVENSIFHIGAVYAMQLARAYPDIDIGEVLKLASTHWRIPYYFPTIGSGGYCIPVSSKYVKKGAAKPSELSILDKVIEYGSNHPLFLARLLKDKGCKKVGMLGVTYKQDLKVHTLSPTVEIIKELINLGIEVKASDPYYSEEEIKNLFSVDSFSFPEGLGQFDAIVVNPPHKSYKDIPKELLIQAISKRQVIIDNMGVWESLKDDIEKKGARYYRIGQKEWTNLK